jgi:ribose/xylose/arabinose/galactoside ABC-type transport system permease subunit
VSKNKHEDASGRKPASLTYLFGTALGLYGLVLILIVLVVIFALLNPNFLTVSNFKNLLEQNSTLAIVAVGITFAIVSKNIDLSPGSITALTGVLVALVFRSVGSLWFAILCGFAAAILIYTLNALLIARFRIDPLIVTLAAWIWARGLAISLTRANSITVRSPFIDFMNSAALFGVLSPPIFLIAIAYAAGWVILNRTKLGRYALAIGGDERAAIAAGIDTGFYKVLIFGLIGVCVGVGTVITVSRLGAAAPNAAFGLELDAIVAVIIGGNPFQGGEGSLRRTFTGVLFIAFLNNGLNNLGMRDSYFYLYKGLAIILALLLDVIGHGLLRSARAVASTASSSEQGA